MQHPQNSCRSRRRFRRNQDNVAQGSNHKIAGIIQILQGANNVPIPPQPQSKHLRSFGLSLKPQFIPKPGPSFPSPEIPYQQSGRWPETSTPQSARWALKTAHPEGRRTGHWKYQFKKTSSDFPYSCRRHIALLLRNKGEATLW
jgi:hypothetical protein